MWAIIQILYFFGFCFTLGYFLFEFATAAPEIKDTFKEMKYSKDPEENEWVYLIETVLVILGATIIMTLAWPLFWFIELKSKRN